MPAYERRAERASSQKIRNDESIGSVTGEEYESVDLSEVLGVFRSKSLSGGPVGGAGRLQLTNEPFELDNTP